MHAIQLSTKTQNCFSSSLIYFAIIFTAERIKTREMLVSSLLKSAPIVHRFTCLSASIALSLTFCVKKKFNISVSRKKKPTCWVNKQIKLYIKAGGLSWNVQTLWVHGYEKESRSCRQCTSREKVVPIFNGVRRH